MRNWKELGEIPDSEEEDGFDSQSTASQDTVVPNPTGTAAATEAQHGDVWDVPLSQGDGATVAIKAQTTAQRLPETDFPIQDSQLRDPWAFPLSQEVDELAEGHHAQAARRVPQPYMAEPPSSPLSSLSSGSFDDLSRPSTLGLSSENDTQNSPGGQQTPIPSVIDMTGATPVSTPSRTVTITTPVVSSELGERESEYIARQAAVRYERSLRARKPIQQHPFLLEAAQYRTSMQSRGLKPLRIAAVESMSRRRDGETQESPYEPESQDSNGADGSGSRETGSQLLGDLDDWAFPSSSPPSPPRPPRVAIPSSQSSSLPDTDGTSIQMDDLAAPDELPALEDLLSHPRRQSNKYTPKRRPTSPRTSSKKKLQRRVLDSDDLLPPVRTARQVSPDSLQDGQGALPPSSSFEPVPNFLEARSKSLARQHQTPQPARARSPATPAPIPDAMAIDSSSESDKQTDPAIHDIAMETDSTESESDGSERIVNTVGRTIRGVLPASWLRLDQQSGRDNIRKAVTSRAMHRSPGRDQRRGVAQKKKGTTSNVRLNRGIWSDESDGETPAIQAATTDDAFPNQTRLMANQEPILPGPSDPYLSGDGSSGMEDNGIDHMLASRKRQLKLAESFQGAVKHRTTPQSATKVRPTKGTQQPKITSAFTGVSQSTPSTSRLPKQHRKRNLTSANMKSHQSAGTTKKKTNRRKASALSILDVIEPDAPHFLRVAARTARQRPNQGRGSPSHKTIRLANREDHVDALSVLSDWRAGSIPQRAAVTSSMRKRAVTRRVQPLSEASGNQDAPKPANPLRKTSSVQKVTQPNKNVTRKDAGPPSMSIRSMNDSRVRQAQLESSGSDPLNSRSFYTGKRALDKLFRATRTAPSTVASLNVTDHLDLRDESPIEAARASPELERRPPQSKTSKKSRYRKQTRPTRENLEAPQYVHAHDPLPRGQDAVDVVQPLEPQGSGVRMTGLGPYGTQYTHHFEVFPLLAGVYFHETSLIGSGILATIAEQPVTAVEDVSRTRVSYALGDQNLRWGPWSEHVSSELGILFDFVAEKLEDFSHIPSNTISLVTKAGDFVLSYIKDHMSFHQASDSKAFFTRFREVLCGFNDKVKVQLQTPATAASASTAMQRIYERVLLAALCVVQICRNEPSFVNEQMQAEDLLKDIAATAVSMLIQLGTNDLRETYRSLNSARAREKGLREKDSTVHSWVTVMKVLDEARILRGSFWDVVQSNLSTRDYINGHDASKHDLLWQDLFSFLPLVEFNTMGVLVPGSRHEVVHEGWSLPQKLLRNVFNLYRENPRQSPSFNNYCRALVGRCHYLVEQWGWRKSSSVVGVIFDFFGSQNLAHLRNEEVYKSPRFLEELSSHPRLEIEPDDRCFHIFLKLVALSIRRLREIEAIKDIRNLVARTMPNHSRQYLKEQNLHQRDLAALRNHHDLLCTLFWACPPDLRPSAAVIEGLVDPESSHKETCLISLRSWSQLARFLVSNGEASIAKVFTPFVLWRDGFFTRMLQQYSSIASEINQQFHSLAKEERLGVSDDMLKAMVSANKIAVQDVLHYSVTASYDAMMQCPDLESAVWSLSTKQLQQVFDHFSAAPPELDWSILTVILKTFGAFLSKIDEFKDGEGSQQRESQLLDSEQADDALQTLDECVAKTYFAMARCVLSNRGEGDKVDAADVVDKAICKELIVTLSSRFASRLVSSGSMRLRQLFNYNKYGLFDAATLKLDLEQRRYLVLCVLSLLKANVNDFSDAGFSLLDVWMLAIVKPREGLHWENQLAEQLYRIGTDFIPEAATGLAVQPHYSSNRDMFEFAISYMRTRVREAEPSQKKTLVSEYAQTLKMVMEQMAIDLRIASRDSAEHPAYVSFVRGIISLIRSHGADICAVDDFYYQISKDYSPPAEDPQLQVAGMIAYELKLNDAGARQQLFFFMFNSFKLAMHKNELREHMDLVWKGIKRPAIRRFVLGKLLPAALRASWQQPPAQIFVDLCLETFEQLLTGSILSTELQPDDLDALLSTIAAIVSGFHELSAAPSTSEVYLINRTVSFMNLIWPSLLILSVRQSGTLQLEAVRAALRAFKSSFQVILRHLGLASGYPYEETGHLLRTSLRHVGRTNVPEDPDIASFRDNIVTDVQRNWDVGEKRIGIKTPAKSRGTQSSTQAGHGVEVPERDVAQLYVDMKSLLAIWIDNYEELYEEDARKRRDDATPVFEDLVF